MNKYGTPNPENHIFYCDKSNWYNELSDGTKTWDVQKLRSFWQEVNREKVKKMDFDFSEFVFPSFTYLSFWEENEKKEFLDQVDFSNAKFLGSTTFQNIEFKKGANFFQCEFQWYFRMREVRIEGVLEFSGSTFTSSAFWEQLNVMDKAYFPSITFKSDFILKNVNFHNSLVLENTNINGNCEIKECHFFRELNASDLTVHGISSFREIKFNDTINFNGSIFLKEALFRKFIPKSNAAFLKFDRSKFSLSGQTFFTELHNTKVAFRSIYFSKQVVFFGVNFFDVELSDCDVTLCSFTNCDFPKTNSGRTYLKAERNYKTFHPNNSRDYLVLMDLYRQLKVNFSNKKDWIESGDAYRSEMACRLNAIKNDIKKGKINLIPIFLVIGFYGVFSGYQQSVSKPLLWLLLLWIGGSLFLHLYENCFGILKAMEECFYAIFPISGKIDPSPYHKSFHLKLVFIRIFGVILLTFFILSTRARLRQ